MAAKWIWGNFAKRFTKVPLLALFMQLNEVISMNSEMDKLLSIQEVTVNCIIVFNFSQVAKSQFQAEKNPLDAALFYLAMKKKTLLWGLFRWGKRKKGEFSERIKQYLSLWKLSLKITYFIRDGGIDCIFTLLNFRRIFWVVTNLFTFSHNLLFYRSEESREIISNHKHLHFLFT